MYVLNRYQSFYSIVVNKLSVSTMALCLLILELQCTATDKEYISLPSFMTTGLKMILNS